MEGMESQQVAVLTAIEAVYTAIGIADIIRIVAVMELLLAVGLIVLCSSSCG